MRSRAPVPIRVVTIALCLLAWGVLARGELDRSPYGPIARAFLPQVHATVVSCDVVLAADTICFSVTPATVAAIAEELEALIRSSDGLLLRSTWRSANGVHHVELLLDDAWGALELWLSEQRGGTVNGMLRYLTERRTPGP